MSAVAVSPLVSICIPTFNGSQFIVPALNSVLSQSYKNLEVLVFDDGSTDGTWELLGNFQDSRVTLHKNPSNLGPEGNWNRALMAANGKYVKIFHQDDLLAPDCIEKQVAALEQEPGAVLAFCRREIVLADGSKLTSRGAPWKDGMVTQAQAARACAWRGSNLLGEPSAVLMRTNVAQNSGGFDGGARYLVDLEYWLRVMRLGPAWYISRPLASFRLSKGQWSARIGLRQGRDFSRFISGLSSGPLKGQPITRLVGRLMGYLLALVRSVVYLFV